VAVVLASASCDGTGSNANTVNVDRSDTSPPKVGLDVYNLPLQSGASSQPQPESIDSTCCDVTRTADGADISLVAGAFDDESGVRAVSIWVETTVTCTEDGTATTFGPGLLGNPSAEARDDRVDPTSASRNLAVTLGLNRSDFHKCPQGAQASRRARVWAEAENFAGGKNRTKTLTLSFD
jgi:hypothetical protein